MNGVSLNLALASLVKKAAHTSWNSGSPKEPGSLVRSITAIFFTLAGMTRTKSSIEKGRNNLIFKTPTFSPLRASTAFCATSAPEPIITMRRSASASPKYWNKS